MTIKATAKGGTSAAQRQRSRAPQANRAPKTMPAGPTADLRAEQALEAIVASATEKLAASRARVLASDTPDGPHELRVGLRRLRSALLGFRPILRREPVQVLVQQSRTLARIVGEQRDADVIIEDIVLPLKGLVGSHQGFSPLLTLLIEQQEAKRKSVRSALKGPAWLALQDSLQRWPTIIDTEQSVDVRHSKIAAKALRRSWKKVDAWGSRLSDLSEMELHYLRKALKRLRYQVELFGPLYKKSKVRKFLVRLRTLQDDLGYLNDVASARRLESLVDAAGSGTSDLHLVVGFVTGWHTATAEQRMKSLESDWDALRHVPRFW